MLVGWLIMLVGVGIPRPESRGNAAKAQQREGPMPPTSSDTAWQCTASDQRYTSARCAMWTTSITIARCGMRNTTR